MADEAKAITPHPVLFNHPDMHLRVFCILVSTLGISNNYAIKALFTFAKTLAAFPIFVHTFFSILITDTRTSFTFGMFTSIVG